MSNRSLQEAYAIEYVPKLVVLAPEGELISTMGRRDIQEKGILAYTSWVMTAKRKSAAALDAKRKAMRDGAGSGEDVSTNARSRDSSLSSKSSSVPSRGSSPSHDKE